jgi:uncharacterized membrane protein YphA (DoxX/SURF4 family)
VLDASTLADVARVVLGAALLVAAVAKIAAGTVWADHAAGVGVPRPLAAVLPWFELALGAALVAGLAEPWPAAAAVVLLVVFTAWTVVHLVRGEHPSCACFGSLSAAPLSWWHAVRNVLLIIVGVMALSL